MSDSLIDIDTSGTDNTPPPGGTPGDAGGGAPAAGSEDSGAGSNGNGGGAARFIEYKGERIEIPENYWDNEANEGKGAANTGALAKAVADLRRQVSEKPKAPDKYELPSLPEELKGKAEINAEDPRIPAVNEWAKKHGITQEAYNDLIMLDVAEKANGAEGDAEWAKEQREALDKALGDDADRVKADLGKWVGGLLGKDLKDNPDMLAEAQALASSAHGVMLLKAIKDKIGERGLPDGKGNDPKPVSESELTRLQASAAYQDSNHPDHQKTVQQVRDGWARLYPDD